MKRKKFKQWCQSTSGEEPRSNKFWYNKDSNAYAMYVDTYYIKSFLSGHRKSIKRAFEWRYTPQGHRYWLEIYEGIAEINQEGIDYLSWMLETYA